LFNLGVIYEEQNNIPKALKFYRRALAAEPQSPDIHFRLARLLTQTGDCAGARPHIRYLLKARPALAPQIKAELSACPGAVGP